LANPATAEAVPLDESCEEDDINPESAYAPATVDTSLIMRKVEGLSDPHAPTTAITLIAEFAVALPEFPPDATTYTGVEGLGQV